MTTESPLSDEPTPSAHLQNVAQPQRLRQQLRIRLEQHLQVESFAPAIRVVGFTDDDSTVLRHGVARPEHAVLGFDLPSEFSSIGVIASSVIATPPQRRHHDAALAIAVDRRGHVASMLATASAGITDTQAPHGWLIDACRRSVGLATEPCLKPSLTLPIALWLDRLLSIILLAHDGPVTWPKAVELCPVPRRWQSSDPDDLGTTLGSTTRSWKALRHATAHGAPTPVAVDAAWAGWMDDPMFARWCLGSFPDLCNLQADVEFLASNEVAENVAVAIRSAWRAFDH